MDTESHENKSRVEKNKSAKKKREHYSSEESGGKSAPTFCIHQAIIIIIIIRVILSSFFTPAAIYLSIYLYSLWRWRHCLIVAFPSYKFEDDRCVSGPEVRANRETTFDRCASYTHTQTLPIGALLRSSPLPLLAACVSKRSRSAFESWLVSIH